MYLKYLSNFLIIIIRFDKQNNKNTYLCIISIFNKHFIYNIIRLKKHNKNTHIRILFIQ